ncbi:MAG TPA: methylase, partial [Thermofilaceae archaeon]|nr:methylase [Thermofilaceae archaeon]
MVYEASEDTVLLLKGVTMLAPGSTRACEIGCGSGIVTLTLTPYAERTLATDIDVGAVAATW